MAYTQADLEIADQHVARGKRHILDQEERIERLRSKGYPIGEAEDLLQLFHATLAQHERYRDVVFEELRAT